MVNEFAELLPEREALGSQSNVANINQGFHANVEGGGKGSSIVVANAPQAHVGQSNTSTDVDIDD